jgi:peptide/nickel transport system permease protein
LARWLDRAADGVVGAGLLGAGVRAGYLLIWLFSLKLGWFPVQGYQRLADGFWGWLHRLLLPAFTLSIIFIALIARVTRTSVLEVTG